MSLIYSSMANKSRGGNRSNYPNPIGSSVNRRN
jgi:hypothetical protein